KGFIHCETSAATSRRCDFISRSRPRIRPTPPRLRRTGSSQRNADKTTVADLISEAQCVSARRGKRTPKRKRVRGRVMSLGFWSAAPLRRFETSRRTQFKEDAPDGFPPGALLACVVWSLLLSREEILQTDCFRRVAG